MARGEQLVDAALSDLLRQLNAPALALADVVGVLGKQVHDHGARLDEQEQTLVEAMRHVAEGFRGVNGIVEVVNQLGHRIEALEARVEAMRASAVEEEAHKMRLVPDPPTPRPFALNRAAGPDDLRGRSA